MNTKTKVWVWTEIVALSPKELVQCARALHQQGFIVVLRPDQVDEGSAATTFANALKLVDVDRAEGVDDEIFALLKRTGCGDLVECGPAQEHELPWSPEHRPVHPGNIGQTGVASFR